MLSMSTDVITKWKSSQMANNLVKWWKTKFLNGYKSFNVECTEGRLPSDTEELLDRRSSDYHTACTTPPLQTQKNQIPSSPLRNEDTPSPQETEHHLNLQEFSCDVSVEGGPHKLKQERQEFSFTLYDFDGHGKITKDDIAGLVTTIYEVLGSSVRVPHYGSKTIKVKLTVSPDQRKHVSATVIDHKDDGSEEKTSRPKQDLNVTIRQSNDKKRYRHKENMNRRQRHYCCRKLNEEQDNLPEASEDLSDVCSRVSPEFNSSEDEEGECSDDQASKCNNRLYQKQYQKHSTAKFNLPNNRCKREMNGNQKECVFRMKKLKKRSSSLQKQELLEIIQSNMDKNNACFQTIRKQTVDHMNNKQLSQHPVKHNKYRSKMSTVPLQYLANMVDPTHFYVDLASLQNNTKFSHNNCQYDKLIDSVMYVANKKVPEPDPFRRYNHLKSYEVHNTPICYRLLEYPADNLNKSVKKPVQKITEHEQSPAVKKNVRKFPHVVLGHTSSPHHLRHRNRQEDQARAMAQVVRWLEQEFSSNSNNTKEKNNSNSWAGDEQKCSSNIPSSPNSGGVERHEHHHVHEHVHHHYHHYQDAPVVV